MSYPNWPATLPQTILQEGYSEDVGGVNVLRTPMDAGPAKMRLRSTSTSEFIKGTMVLNRTQWQTLRTFYLTTLARVLPFTWTHPSTAAAANFRFVTQPAIAPVGGSYVRVSLDLEVVP